ncbi:DUF4870 domain-containing protein [Alkalicoccus luteus]|uniref:DUF4870 domain-containing protein n=1 Tax=Alkalicoccus luteus TaxID=1237094 RepID=A0A969Q0M8_9BACI|nr:DUF4870 domain-containing protein [Alkalicoccus luteus]NJP38957.1 DUF4870 domain-containing protein [Alkalicoccus luteus]
MEQVKSEDKLLAGLIYITSFFFPIIAPIVIWIIRKNDSAFVDYHGREYFNLFISYTIYSIIAGVLTFILIGWLILPVLGLALIVLTIVGAVKAISGEPYRFPLILRLIPSVNI